MKPEVVDKLSYYNIYVKLIYIYLLLLFTPLEFFPSVLADGFSLGFE